MQRYVWLLRYRGESVPRLEAGAFERYGLLPIDECYSATMEGQHHTLLYLKKKCREPAVLKFMEDYGAKQEPARTIECNIWAFSGSNEKSGLYEHPSFRALVEQHGLSGGAPSATYYSWLERPGIHYGGIMACYMKKAGGGGAGVGTGIVSEVGDDFLV
jgi:hypothetical protein